MLIRRTWVLSLALVGLCFALGLKAVAQDQLAGNTVLIVRHAEKPDEGSGLNGLTAAGTRRAQAYVTYFQPFRENGLMLRVSSLFAGADSAASQRPRLTLEPLSKALGMPLDTSVGTKEPKTLVDLLHTRPHGKTPLICWRHGQIPLLLQAFGASPEKLLPGGKWPDETFDWVIILQFDGQAKLVSERRIQETLKVE